MKWKRGDWAGLLVLLTMPLWLYLGLPENARFVAKWITGVDPPAIMSPENEHAITVAYVDFWEFVGRTIRDVLAFWLPYLPIGVVVYVAVRMANRPTGRQD